MRSQSEWPMNLEKSDVFSSSCKVTFVNAFDSLWEPLHVLTGPFLDDSQSGNNVGLGTVEKHVPEENYPLVVIIFPPTLDPNMCSVSIWSPGMS